jgi:hypothetical protein
MMATSYAIDDISYAKSFPLPAETMMGQEATCSVGQANEANTTVDFLAGELQRLSMDAAQAFDDASGPSTAMPPATSLNNLSYKLIARSMLGLSPAEREQHTHELHGLAEEIKETPALIRQSLNEMEGQLQHKLRQKTTSGHAIQAYERALAKDKKYVSNDDFRLKFLRADRFNPLLAAERLLLYFEEKEDMFGTDLLTTDIRMEHLGEHGMDAMNRGGIQILPERDAAGRVVILTIFKVQKSTNDEDLIRQRVRALFRSL